MLHPDARRRLLRAREHAAEAISIAACRQRDNLDRDRTLELALTELVDRVARAAEKLGLTCEFDFHWPQAGFDNCRVDRFDQFNRDLLWTTVRHELPSLVAELDGVLS